MEGGGQFVYHALDPSGNTIRLLTLLPGQFSDKVHLSVTHESFQDEKRTPYECISYTWGEPQTPEKVYIWQKSPANVSNVDSLQFLHPRINLLTALKYIRLADTPRVIWVDAICIDQDNITERSQQVAHMGQIYNYAAQVLVWLGPEDESTSMALETIERLSAGILLTEDHRNCKTIPGSEAEVVERRFNESKFTPQHWKSLNQLIRRPWFERLWIRQEVQLASKVLVRCGYAEIEWGKIEKVIIFVEQKINRVYFRVEDILRCRSLFPYIGSDSLTYTLHRSSFCKCSDHRDMVYANLSTSSEMKALQIKPNYNSTTAKIFKYMTYKYVQHFKNLELFRLCDLKNLPRDFKSFVPNFATQKPDSRLFSVYAHAGTRQSFVDTEGGNVKVKGRKVAQIQGVSTAQKPLVKNTLSHTDIIKTYRQWEPEDLMTCTTYPQGGTLLDAFVMILSNGFCKETYHLSHLPTIQESKESFLAAIWSRADASQIKNSKFKPYLGEVTSDRRSEIFFQTVEGYIGASPTDVQDGDIISVLVGASVPIVLRSVTDHQNAYQVVGPCFLQGVMFGEFLLGPLPDNWLCVRHDYRRWYFRQQGSENRIWEDPRLWPMPSHWQAHFCDFDDSNGPCDGSCELEYEKAAHLINPWFFNTQSKERSEYDPRLDLQGLEAGGIELESFTLV